MNMYNYKSEIRNPKFEVRKILNRIYEADIPQKDDLIYLLSLGKVSDLETVFNFADEVRKKFMGEGIFLRGVVEFSNYCKNSCLYCGLNKNNVKLKKYRLSEKEIFEAVAKISEQKIKTVVLQSGEDDEIDPKWISRIISGIKSKFDIAVTLSVGEKDVSDYRLWRKAGADRYLLKIETTDKTLYKKLHPGMSFANRIRCLKDLRNLGYEVGSGIIVGLKNQTIGSIADDIIFFKKEEFDMIGIGPFIPHKKTKLGAEKTGSVNLTLKTVALTRIVTKNSNIPATTALGSLDKDYRISGLKAGANVLMPNFTPLPYRKLYEIYPGKRCVNESPGLCAPCLLKKAGSIGRFIDYSKGDSFKKYERIPQSV